MVISDLLRIGMFTSVLISTAHAQPDSLASSLAHTDRLVMDGWGLYASTAIGSDLVWGIYRGGYLDRGLRRNTADRLKGINRGGYELGISATYTWGHAAMGSERLASRITIGQRSFMGVRFAPDVFRLALFGNADHVDRTAELGPSSFHQVTYQRLSYGIEDRKTGSFIEVGVVNGKSLHTGTIAQADLYTAPQGRYLELDLDGDYQLTDTAGRKLSNGLGVVVDLQYKQPIRLFGQGMDLRFTASDLGFIAWNSRSLTLNTDTTLHFSGFEVADILDLEGLVLNEHTLQDSLGLGYATGGFLLFTPAKLEAALGFGKELHSPNGDRHRRMSLTMGHRFIPGYVPEVAFMARVGINELGDRAAGPLGYEVLFHGQVGYGGFGGLFGRLGADLGLGGQFRLGVDWVTYLKLGNGARVGLSYSW